MENLDSFLNFLMATIVIPVFVVVYIGVLGWFINKVVGRWKQHDAQNKRSTSFWPKIEDRDTAISVIKDSALIIFGLGLFNGLLGVLASSSLDNVLLDSMFYFFIGLGIWKFSRVVAGVGLGIFIISIIYGFLNGDIVGVALILILSVVFINALRATNYYHQTK
ncbi:MAG: hypothetical protein HQM14_04085 [SAR324 cluster bacterium]|nr:hypothetical protein [SAR324 cluster bacterium]